MKLIYVSLMCPLLVPDVFFKGPGCVPDIHLTSPQMQTIIINDHDSYDAKHDDDYHSD